MFSFENFASRELRSTCQLSAIHAAPSRHARSIAGRGLSSRWALQMNKQASPEAVMLPVGSCCHGAGPPAGGSGGGGGLFLPSPPSVVPSPPAGPPLSGGKR